MSKWIAGIVVLLVCVGLGVAVYGKVGERLEKKANLDAEASTRKSDQDKPPPLTLARPVAGPATETLLLTGSLKAEAEVALGFKLPGRVIEVAVKRGDVVSKGQLLARIDTRDLDAQMQQADAGRRAVQAQRNIAEDALRRARALAEAGAASEQAVVAAAGHSSALAANVDQVSAQRRYLELVQAEATLHSPIDGVVIQAPSAPGFVVQMMSPPSFQIQRLSRLEFQGHLDDGNAARLEPGGVLRLVSAAGVRATGTLKALIPSVDAMTRRVPIYAEVDNPDGRLFAGSMVSASVEVRAVPTLAIPLDCLLTGETAAVLVVADGRKLLRRELDVARVDGPRLLVRGGLSVDDLVVVSPGVTFREGDTAPTADQIIEARHGAAGHLEPPSPPPSAQAEAKRPAAVPEPAEVTPPGAATAVAP